MTYNTASGYLSPKPTKCGNAYPYLSLLAGDSNNTSTYKFVYTLYKSSMDCHEAAYQQIPGQ